MAVYYILDEAHQPAPVDITAWIAWREAHPKASEVACTAFLDGPRVSTIFVGINQALDTEAPLLFETRIFFDTCAELDAMQRHTASWSDAVAMHQSCCEKVQHALYERTARDAKDLPNV